MKRTPAALLVVLACCAVARADERPAEKRPPVEARQPGHLEYPTDPPIDVPREARITEPARTWEHNGHVSVQVNVDRDGNNIVGDAANEPSLAVNPLDPGNMVIGWRQFDTIASGFREAGWASTTNGGQRWYFRGAIQDGTFRSDPVVDADTQGVFYYNSLTADNWDGFPSNFRCHVFRSSNGGQSWGPGTYAYGGDKQWQVIDHTDGLGRDNIYAYWTRWYTCEGPGCDGHFTRSYNRAFSFTPCIDVPGNPLWGTLAVGPDGELYILGDGFTLARSSNVQDPDAGTVTWDVSTTFSLGGSQTASAGPNPGGLLGQAWIAVDHSEGATRGNVYALCSVDPPGADPLDVMFARSTDGGLTWSTPVRVNDDPAGNNAWQWFGTMSVAPNGRIDAIWLDTRNSPGAYDSQLFYSYSEDAGVTWSTNEEISPVFDPSLGYPQQNKMGDYFDMSSDDVAANVAYAATFNGEQDVYFTRITRLLSIAFPDGLPELITPGDATDLTVRISPGVENYIGGTASMYYRYDDGAFTEVPLTPLGDDLYTVTLPPAYCDDNPEFYFTAEGDQSGLVTRPPGAPDNVYTAAVGEIVTFYEELLDSDPGWTAEDQWAFGQPTGGGGAYGDPDPTSGYTGDNVYGYNLNGDYEPSLYTPRNLTSTAIDCTGQQGVTLSFWRWLGVETPTYDHARLYVSNNGVNWLQIWENTEEVNDGQWTFQSYDISAVADDQPTVYLRWAMGPTDSAWQWCGWNIDDIRLEAYGCTAPPVCAGDANCDGAINWRDIDYFVAAQNDNASAWAALFAPDTPGCPFDNNDVTGDGSVNWRDIDPFVALMNTTCP